MDIRYQRHGQFQRWVCREEFYDVDEGGEHVANEHEGVARLTDHEERACGPG